MINASAQVAPFSPAREARHQFQFREPRRLCQFRARDGRFALSAEQHQLVAGGSVGDVCRIDDEVLAHISPAHSENINFFGTIDVDIDGELAQLGPTGYRPLRVRDTLF